MTACCVWGQITAINGVITVWVAVPDVTPASFDMDVIGAVNISFTALDSQVLI